MPDLKPFIVSGIALGSIYALSGVGIVVLYRAAGVLNFAYGAFGAVAAYVAWQLIDGGSGAALAIVAGAAACVAVTTAFGLIVGGRLAGRDVLQRASVTVGAALAVLGLLLVIWGTEPRTLNLPTDGTGFEVSGAHVNLTQLIALGLAVAITVLTGALLRFTSLGLAMRAMACDRELSAALGIRVRRVEVFVWSFIGLLAGVSGILLGNLVALNAQGLTFLVIAALAAGIIGGFRSLWLTLGGGLLVGLVQSCATPFASVSQYRSAAPFLLAIIVLVALPGLADRRMADR